MLSEKAIYYFKKRNPQFDVKSILQDFTDEEIRHVMLTKHLRSFEELTNYLFNQTSDREIKAHLRGYESYSEKRQSGIELGKIFSKGGCSKDSIVKWWCSKFDSDNPLTDEELEKIMKVKKE
ncbi:hypothetical protein [Bulleidia sp. zg-1006]|uniref:hypothetical protein n=1 Tax=Bulleidia sp. zg-1006 TaxID=2806552 RepID=UPI00193A4EF1|nr:hypothetical protein [Bulleidia sp. zg-1006]QRG86389.1 hypothetical protein JOS54_05915 [Bulleidia sp. zg-1006]